MGGQRKQRYDEVRALIEEYRNIVKTAQDRENRAAIAEQAAEKRMLELECEVVKLRNDLEAERRRCAALERQLVAAGVIERRTISTSPQQT